MSEYYLFPPPSPMPPPPTKDRVAAPRVHVVEVIPTIGPFKKDLHRLARVSIPPVAAEVVVETPPMLLSDPPIRRIAAISLLSVGTVRLFALPIALVSRLNSPLR